MRKATQYGSRLLPIVSKGGGYCTVTLPVWWRVLHSDVVSKGGGCCTLSVRLEGVAHCQ